MNMAASCIPETTPLQSVRNGDEDERARILACNRVLLYARGLDLDANAGLELATESLRRSGGAADLQRTLEQMHVILHERGVEPFLSGKGGGRLASAPPISRKSMVSEGVPCRSFTGWVWNCLQGFVHLFIPGRKAAWTRRKA